MSSSNELADRVRRSLDGVTTFEEKAMFGGIAFMVNGHMCVAASKRGLLVRVGPERYQEALAREGARPMEMRGRAMTGYVFIDPSTLTARTMKDWLRMGVSLVQTLPPKSATATRPRSRKASK
jgi:TfoX/Sxy family transcriptional regulator of competence genes